MISSERTQIAEQVQESSSHTKQAEEDALYHPNPSESESELYDDIKRLQKEIISIQEQQKIIDQTISETEKTIQKETDNLKQEILKVCCCQLAHVLQGGMRVS